MHRLIYWVSKSQTYQYLPTAPLSLCPSFSLMASTALTPVVSSTFPSCFLNQSKSNSLLIQSSQCLFLSINRKFDFFLSQSKPSSSSLIQSPRSPIFPGNRRLGLVSTRNSSSIVCSYPQQKVIKSPNSIVGIK